MRGLYLLLALSIFLSGCAAPPPPADEQVPWLRLAGAPLAAAIINATSQPGVLYWEFEAGTLCQTTTPTWATVKIYNQTGHYELVEMHFNTAMNPPTNRTIRLNTAGPWLVVGEGPLCTASNNSTLVGVAEGFVDWRYWDGGSAFEEIRLPVHVIPGERVGRTVWEPGPYVWSLLQLGHRSSTDREGEMWGNISAIDSNGNVTRWDSYGLVDSDVWYAGYQFVDGPYTIELVLDQPAIRPTTWTYTIQYKELDAGVCEYGFEWADLCE